MPAPTIHVVDLSAGDADIVATLGEACREVGFFLVVHHGVDAAVESEAWELTRAFFDLPLADRLQVAMPEPGYPYGYAPFAYESLASSLGDVTPPDLKETYTVGPPEDLAAIGRDPDEAWARLPTPWPTALPNARSVYRRYYDAMAELAARLLSFGARSLGLGADHFAPLIDRHVSALRMLNYPPLAQPPKPGQLRAGAHTDYGTLTILRQEQRPGGLQVLAPSESGRSRDGAPGAAASREWIDVDHVPGSFVVNLGDAMARWTNDRWRSTLHRVVVPPIGSDADARAESSGETRRQSIAFFHNANWDAVIECLAPCTDPQDPPRYVPIAAGPHLMAKFRSTQAVT
jgi:isopenicillin N synthase-like dioxygenase